MQTRIKVLKNLTGAHIPGHPYITMVPGEIYVIDVIGKTKDKKLIYRMLDTYDMSTNTIYEKEVEVLELKVVKFFDALHVQAMLPGSFIRSRNLMIY
jgi:hypothetical protein